MKRCNRWEMYLKEVCPSAIMICNGSCPRPAYVCTACAATSMTTPSPLLSSNPTISSNLPIELEECIVDFLHDDVHSLAACALAGRALLPTARFHIWQDLSVPVQTQPQHVRMQGLLEILDGNPAIPPLVRALTLRGVLSPHSRGRIRERWNDPAGTMHLWERFPNLRVLRFVSFKFTMGLHQLLPVAYGLSHLEELAILDETLHTSRNSATPTRTVILRRRVFSLTSTAIPERR